MKRILLGILLASTAMSAQAADLAARPYTKAPVMATVYDWTGFYIGANVGVGLARDREILTTPAVPSAMSNYLQPQGGLGGGQIGYNWQTPSVLGNLVFGLEADIQGSGMSDTGTSLTTAPPVVYNQSLDWFGTVRGRVGIASGPVLAYVTAGYAYGNVRTTVTEGGVTMTPLINRMQDGWVYGSGVEAALGGNWTGKIEYLYLNLGNKNDPLAVGTQNQYSEIRENIFRVGLNYRIGGNSNYTPVVAANWSGFYLGGNFGGGTARDRSSLVAAGVGLNEQFNLAPDGVNGGVQAGYNWQAANWVFGLEADIQASAQRDNRTCIVACNAGLFASYDATLPWFGTARGRVGYSLGSTLLYATAGYAYGGVRTAVASTIPGVTGTFDTTRGGWTAGGGIETPFTFLGLFGPNWTSKTEYLYVDLGSSNNALAVGAAGVPGSFNTHVQEHIFRTGLNYHFNTPVVAKY
ncbi:MAG: porin family protein [Proteobacteria bacterium]|nr:porin family protein [Pseudomonadota bacterium]